MAKCVERSNVLSGGVRGIEVEAGGTPKLEVRSPASRMEERLCY